MDGASTGKLISRSAGVADFTPSWFATSNRFQEASERIESESFGLRPGRKPQQEP